MRKEYAGGAVSSTLTVPINASDMTIEIGATQGWPVGTYPFVAMLREAGKLEKVLCSSRTNGTLTVLTRGYDGTSATTFSTQAIVEHVLDAESTSGFFNHDGSIAATDDWDMGGNKLTNLAAPVGDNDAARLIDIAGAGDFYADGSVPLTGDLVPSTQAGTNLGVEAGTRFSSMAAYAFSAGDGTATNPAFRFFAEPNSGFYKTGTGEIGVSIQGNRVLFMDATRFYPDNAVHIIDGTAATPALTFQGDADTGIYRHSSNTLAIALGGAERYLFYSGSTGFIPGDDGVRNLGSATNRWKLIHMANGTAAAPSYTFGGDTGTGIYWLSPGALAFSTGGVRRAFVDANGNFRMQDGTAADPAYSFINDPDTGLYRVGGGMFAASLNGKRADITQERIWLGPAEFASIAGSPTLASTYSTTYIAAWSFDPNVNETIGTMLMLPSHWASYRVKYYWYAGNATGSVVWSYSRLTAEPYAQGQAMTTSGVGLSATTATSGANLLNISDLGVTNREHADSVVNASIARSATSGSDTYTGDAQLVGVLLERVT